MWCAGSCTSRTSSCETPSRCIVNPQDENNECVTDGQRAKKVPPWIRCAVRPGRNSCMNVVLIRPIISKISGWVRSAGTSNKYESDIISYLGSDRTATGVLCRLTGFHYMWSGTFLILSLFEKLFFFFLRFLKPSLASYYSSLIGLTWADSQPRPWAWATVRRLVLNVYEKAFSILSSAKGTIQ